jgi:molecular chaperone HtpG
MPIVAPAPNDIRDTALYRGLLEKSRAGDGFVEHAEVFTQATSPLLDLIVAGPFRQYTLHNRHHAIKVVHIIGSLLTPNVLSAISPVDCLVIIYAAYFHDLGMCLSSTERQRLIISDEFQAHVRDWPELALAFDDAQRRLDDSDAAARFSIEASLFELQEAALASFLRPRHATTHRYQELTLQLEQATGRSDLFAIQGVSFKDYLIEICASHVLDSGILAEVKGTYEERFPRDAVIGGHKLNVQFCAGMLRLGDIMDFDRERTPRVLFENLGIASRNIPGADVSLVEWQKHLSVTSLELGDGELVVAADCTHPVIESAIRHSCALIERELRDTAAVFKRNTAAVLAAYSVDLPTIVRPRVRSLGYVFKDLAFHLNHSAILSLLMGERLYSTPYAALRELIQNAIDACSARRMLDSNFEPRIRVVSEDDHAGALWIRIEDNGIGMDEYVLSEYFFRVGSCYYESPDFQRLARKGDTGFVPIARFGIGIMSVFMIADVMEVTTQSDFSARGDTQRRQFIVEGRGGLAFVTEKPRDTCGTTVRIRIKERQMAHSDTLHGMESYLHRAVLRPRCPVELCLGDSRLTLQASRFTGVSSSGLKYLESKGFEAVTVPLNRWSDVLNGTAVVFFRRTKDGHLTHKFEDGRIIRLGPDLDPNRALEHYEGNRITVNGFTMSLRKSARLFGGGKTNRLAIALDCEALGMKDVVYDVSRERLAGTGASRFKHLLTRTIVAGFEELGTLSRLVPGTRALILNAAEARSDEFETDEEFLQAVMKELPSNTIWEINIHKAIAIRLGVSRTRVHRAIDTLLKTGRVVKIPRKPRAEET